MKTTAETVEALGAVRGKCSSGACSLSEKCALATQVSSDIFVYGSADPSGGGRFETCVKKGEVRTIYSQLDVSTAPAA